MFLMSSRCYRSFQFCRERGYFLAFYLELLRLSSSYLCHYFLSELHATSVFIVLPVENSSSDVVSVI